ncbi:MAG: ATP-binding protein [Boseongicola sp. SB0677_bin_26]|nr:ATP-binding protein [Boseongicola sp. SB0665_bin_10]MYG26734.1 ATP-binding protein [Boseongicola sp. SB0677_bin_26]
MELELPPRASSMTESLRDMGYSLRTALADVIDNSITAGASSIRLFADTHHAAPAIGVLDDGVGMTRDELFEAMRPGARNPLETRSATDLGRFGLGLKTASFSQCRRLTLVTRKASIVSCATWDLDKVAERDRWVVTIPDSAESIRWVERLRDDGTLVVWEKLDRLVDPERQDGRHDLVRQLDEAATHIEFVFHRFLSGREGRRLAISMNDRELRPFDPFNSNHPATQHHTEETVRLDSGEIRIWPVTLPHHDKVTADEWKRFAGPEGYVSNQGFYLYRNRRLIVHGTWFRLARQLELTKLARVGIDIPNTLDADWKIDVKKASAQPPAAVRDRLRRIIERIGVPSRRTYTGRGTKLTESSRLPVWRRVQDKNHISYRIDEENPVISTFRDDLDPAMTREFERILRLLASTFPLEALHVDISASPEEVRPSRMGSEDLRIIASSMWHILRGRGQSPTEIEEWMRSADPFRTRWEETSRALNDIRKGAVESEDL